MSAWTWRTGLAGLAIVAATAYAAGQMPSRPYAGQQTRTIKALSEEQIADLKAGRGMGLALAAELNGYPGPSHLLELADQLELTVDQRAGIQRLFETMKAESIPIGDQLLARETELDRRFADRTVTLDILTAAVAAIGEAQTRLRAAHLKYHLLTPPLLTQHQMRRYAELRGYAAGHERRHPGAN